MPAPDAAHAALDLFIAHIQGLPEPLLLAYQFAIQQELKYRTEDAAAKRAIQSAINARLTPR